MIRLSTCPGCGSRAVSVKYAAISASSGPIEGWQGVCDKCGTASPVRADMTDAAREWNRIGAACGCGEAKP